MKIKIELYVIDTRIITAITWKTDEGCARGRRPLQKTATGSIVLLWSRGRID